MISYLAQQSEQVRSLRQIMSPKDKRAEELLMRWLTPRQLEQYQMWGLFEATRGPRHHYVVCPLAVYKLHEPLSSLTQQPIAVLCMVPTVAYYPWPDLMLAKKIAIETYSPWRWVQARVVHPL